MSIETPHQLLSSAQVVYTFFLTSESLARLAATDTELQLHQRVATCQRSRSQLTPCTLLNSIPTNLKLTSLKNSI